MERLEGRCPRCERPVVITNYGVSHDCEKPLIYRDLRKPKEK